MTTVPGSAVCSRRAAMFTASPTANDSPRVGSPAMTSPVFTPMRARILIPQVRSNSSFSSWSAPRISTPARTARRASSSCNRGMPNTAMMASPMNFSVVPPWR